MTKYKKFPKGHFQWVVTFTEVGPIDSVRRYANFRSEVDAREFAKAKGKVKAKVERIADCPWHPEH